MSLIESYENSQLSESDQCSGRIMITDLTGVFLVIFIAAVVRFAFNTPVPSFNGHDTLRV